ncbi:MAG: hypothetical protein QNJ73_02345 [Gammaproteobacteria bacterium]|nr:hypothetical protein [Gammaproteobacteria bacterium]
MIDHVLRVSLTCLLVLLGSGCGSGDREEPKPLEESVFDPLTSTLDKAEQVDDLNRDRMQQLNDQMEGNER